MGVIRPPWIPRKWFRSCPFNYCDHFGDKEVLGKVCVVCREDLKNNIPSEYYYEIKTTPSDLWEETISLVVNNKLIDLEDDKDYAAIPVYRMIQQYGYHIHSAIQGLQSVPEKADIQLVNKSMDVLSHSRFYIVVKLTRALSSREAAQGREFDFGIADSKTSAFFAYIAIKRNARALLALSKHRPLVNRRVYYLKLASVSVELYEMIQQEFFPDDKLIYEEIGCNDFKE